MQRCATPNPWYDDDIEEARLKRKTCEKRGGIQSLTYIAISMLLPVTSARPLYLKKTEYYRDKLEHANNKTMFDLVKILSGKQHQRPQPNFLQIDKGCDMFSEYFKNKTVRLVTEMQRQSGSLHHQFLKTPLFTHSLNYFTETTDHDIVDIIRRTDKTCRLDPLPANILKTCTQSLAPVITNITGGKILTGSLHKLSGAQFRNISRLRRRDKYYFWHLYNS